VRTLPTSRSITSTSAIHIWVRRPLDWEDEEAVVAQLADSSMVPLWNATFSITYQRFRHRVAQIAQLNHSRVEGAVVSGWDEIPDGALVVPVDDDDWFAPGAARMLEAETDPDAIAYLWTSRWIEVPIDLGHRLYLLRRRLFPRTPPKWICSTNNYAMVKSPETRKPLGDHVSGSRWFDGPVERGDPSVKRIDPPLSVANRTLASQTTLLTLRKREIGRRELLRKYRRHIELYERPLPPELDWCRPYVEMMAGLMGELEIRR
jgi:hypothetical protein